MPCMDTVSTSQGKLQLQEVAHDRQVHLQLLPSLEVVCLPLQVLLVALPHASAVNPDSLASALFATPAECNRGARHKISVLSACCPIFTAASLHAVSEEPDSWYYGVWRCHTLDRYPAKGQTGALCRECPTPGSPEQARDPRSLPQASHPHPRRSDSSPPLQWPPCCHSSPLYCLARPHSVPPPPAAHSKLQVKIQGPVAASGSGEVCA